MRRPKGFTIVEVLVVIAVVSLLMSVLLPAMGNAREATRAVYCRSNLRTMQSGWLLVMQRDKFRIPYTKKTFLHPHWKEVLSSIYPDAPYIYGNNVVSFNTCPSVQASRKPMMYTSTPWGYPVNTWWSNTGAELNEQKSWHHINHPSQYPWFTDPEVYVFSNGFNASAWLPNTAETSLLHWGVGPNHSDGEVFNVSYADMSVRSVDIDVMHASAPGGGDFTWFENR